MAADDLAALEIPLPVDGMAPDLVDDGLPPTKAKLLQNVLLDRPGRIVPRGSISRVDGTALFAGTTRPFGGKGWEMNGRRLIGGQRNNAADGVVNYWNAPYLRRSDAAELVIAGTRINELGTGANFTTADVEKSPGLRGVRVGDYVYGPSAYDSTVSTAGTSGPSSGGTFADDAGVGTLAWTNPGNAAASDNVYVTATGAAVSHYLKATNFGFALPAGAVIEGIKVEVEQKSPSATDNHIYLVKGGTIQSSAADRSAGAVWPAADAYATYGGSTDLWGNSWTQADINAVGFGVAISANVLNGNTASIDHVRITVYYSLATMGAQQAREMLRWDGNFADANIIKQTNCPKYGIDVAAHNERLFVLGGDDPAAPGIGSLDFSMLYFSNPGGPTTGVLGEWQTDGLTNKIKVGEGNNDPGMALAHVGSDLMLLKRKSLWVLRGYSPETYVLKQVAADMGCVDPRSVVECEGNVYFMSERGFYRYDGAQLTNVSEGLNNTVLRALVATYKDGSDAPGDAAVQGGGYINADLLSAGYILLSIGRAYTDADHTPALTQFLFDPKRLTWVYFASAVTGALNEAPCFIQRINERYVGLGAGATATRHYMDAVTDRTELAVTGFIDSGASAVIFETPMILRPWRLAGPGHRGWVHRLSTEYLLDSQNVNVAGWVVTVQGSESASGALQKVLTLPSANDGLYLRLRDTQDILLELPDILLRIDRPAGVAANFAIATAELRVLIVHWADTRQRS